MTTIFRKRLTSNFSVISNEVFESGLSAEAIGVLCYLLSKPDNWVLIQGHLSSKFDCGRDRMQRIISELIDVGYIRKNRPRDPVTKAYLTTEYIIVDSKTEPLPENPVVGATPCEPTDGKPVTGNPPLLNTEESNTDSNKSPKRAKRAKVGDYTEDFLQSIWQPYPRKTNTSKSNAFKKWLALSDADQALLRGAIPAFAVAKRGTDEQYIPHLEFFISRRIFETVAPVGEQAQVASIDRQTWENMARIYAGNSNWPRGMGPEPGHPRCMMPPDLQRQFVNIGHTEH